MYYFTVLFALTFFSLRQANSMRSSITNAYLGCMPGTGMVVNSNTTQAVTSCQTIVPTGWLLADLAPSRRGSAFVGIYPLTKDARLLMVGRYGLRRRLLFDSQASCNPASWKPCHFYSACQPCLMMAADSWFADFSTVEVIIEGQVSDFCSSQYMIRMEYETYHMFLTRESDAKTGPMSAMGSLDSTSAACPSFGEYFTSNDERIQMCVISSRDLMDQQSNNKKDDGGLFTTPIANCSQLGSVVRLNNSNRRQPISHVGVMTADMPLRLVFAVGFVVLISGLYSARRWRTSSSSEYQSSAAAMFRLSSMWRYHNNGSNNWRRGDAARFRYTTAPRCHRPLLAGATTAAAHSSDNNNQLMQHDHNNDDDGDVRIESSLAAPPCYSSTTMMNMPPPSYDEVVLVQEATTTSMPKD